MAQIGKQRERVKRPIPQPNERPIEVPDWPQPRTEPNEQPLEVPNWPQPVTVPCIPR